jgi:glycerophosphoryl diester phosphodiesterase
MEVFLRRQRLAAGAVIGAVAIGVTGVTMAAPPLLRQASAEDEPAARVTARRPGLAPAGVGRLEAASHPTRSGPSAARRPQGLAPATPPPSTVDPSVSIGAPASVSAVKPPAATLGRHGQPLIIGHRGASAYRPEETLDSYRLAIAQGADYIEADLVMTGDGALVARHENELSAATDVTSHPEFADRRRTKTVNGATVTGWFTEDFTLAELRTLRASGRGQQTPASTQVIPTLQEIIQLARAQRRTVGLYLELKTPAYFTSLGLAPEPELVDALRANRLAGAAAPVYVESFDAASLRAVHQLADVPEIQLVGGTAATDTALTPAELAGIREYAVGIGIDRARLGENGPDAQALVDRAHADQLEVHVFTFAGDAQIAYRACFGLGVDGIFTDNPDLALTARRHLAAATTTGRKAL